MFAGYAIAFVAGAAGSVHCVGMCGAFPLGLAASGGRLPAQLLYNFGRLNSLAFFGVVAGGLGAGWLAAGPLPVMERWLAIASGVLMAVVGLEMLGWLPEITTGWARRFHGTLAALLRGTAGTRSAAAPLALGVLNAFLPCQLIYAAAARAAGTGSMVQGAATMVAFGLGTVPAMVALGVFGVAGTPRVGDRLRTIASVSLVAFGAFTVMRGLVPLCLHVH